MATACAFIASRRSTPLRFSACSIAASDTEQRLAILQQILVSRFNLQSELPEDLDGVPLLNNMRSWFFSPSQPSRRVDDVLRSVARIPICIGSKSIGERGIPDQAFDDALTVKQTNVNLTMGLFWIRPDAFLESRPDQPHLFGNPPAGVGI